MRKLQPAELARMQATQTESLNDRCQHIQRQVAVNEYGQPDETWTLGPSYWCGFAPISKDEAMGEAEVPLVDAVLRVPLIVIFPPTDRVKITHRHSAAVDSPETFEIFGQPERGPSGLVYYLKRVTDGSGV